MGADGVSFDNNPSVHSNFIEVPAKLDGFQDDPS